MCMYSFHLHRWSTQLKQNHKVVSSMRAMCMYVCACVCVCVCVCLCVSVCYRSTVEQQGSRLKVLEKDNVGLRDQVDLMNKSLSTISLEREELRDMNQKSSAELRKALEVRGHLLSWAVGAELVKN